MHIGSGTDLEHLSQVCGAMEQAAAEVGPSLRLDQRRRRAAHDLPARPTPTSIWPPTSPFGTPRGSGLQDRFGHAVRLEIEPGRYLVAESGYLVAEIRAVKRQDDNTFYLLDAGFNNLARPILYGAYHPMSIVPADGDTRAAGARGDRRRAAVRVGRHLHAGGGRLRLHPPLARGQGRRVAGDRVRRGLRVRDGLELQLPAPGGRSA